MPSLIYLFAWHWNILLVIVELKPDGSGSDQFQSAESKNCGVKSSINAALL